MKDLEYLLGFYSVTTEVALMQQAVREVRKATGTKCSALLLVALEAEPDKSKMRKACLKINKLAESKQAVIRSAIASRAQLAIKMEL